MLSRKLTAKVAIYEIKIARLEKKKTLLFLKRSMLKMGLTVLASQRVKKIKPVTPSAKRIMPSTLGSEEKPYIKRTMEIPYVTEPTTPNFAPLVSRHSP